MLSQTQTTQTSLLNKTLCTVAGFFALTVSVLLSCIIYACIVEYKALIMRVTVLFVIVLILSFTVYVALSVWLALQYRYLQNESLQPVKNLPPQPDNDMEIEQKILDLHHEGESLNQIALAVYGKKGGFYNTQIREVLSSYHIQV